jgi:hypothetical protein
VPGGNLGNHRSRSTYEKRWAVEQDMLRVREAVAHDPPRTLRGAPMDRAVEMVERLKELEALSAQDPGLPACGRALLEIEEKERYQLSGYTMSPSSRRSVGFWE